MENRLSTTPQQENPLTNSPNSSKEFGSGSSLNSSYYDGILEQSELIDFDTDTEKVGLNFSPMDCEKDSHLGIKDDVVLDVSPIRVLDSHLGVKDFDTEKDDVVLNAKKPEVVGAGLVNLGNTCFLNAVLQCFIHTVPLLDSILSDMHSSECRRCEGGFCLLCNLRKVVELSLTSTNKVVSPYSLVENLSYFSSSFQRYRQEDAHEFLQCFLDRLESCCDAIRSSDASSPGDNLVKQVFGGRLVSKVKCTNCGHCSDTYEPSIDLSLEIGDADSLFTALQSFTKVEKIEDSETKFTCEGCKKQVSIEKQLALDKVPAIASFHLKRFTHEGNSTQKIDKHVAFPKLLNLQPFTCNRNTGNVALKYELYAVVVHAGQTSASGHYTCFVRLSPNTWCKFDDSRVFQVAEDIVLSQEAYILFYAQEGTPWFSNFIETQKLRLSSIMSVASPKSVLDITEASSFSPFSQRKTSDQSNVASGPLESDHFGVGCSETKYNRRKLSVLKSNMSKDYLHGFPDTAEPAKVVSHTPLTATKKFVLPQSLIDKLTKEASSIDIVFQTPLRSPSPEIYREDPPDTSFPILHNHPKSVDRVSSCKRKLEKEMDIHDDFGTREARKLIRKTIPGSRGRQLMAAMGGSKSESSVNKKKCRMGVDPQRRDDRNTTTRYGSGIKPPMRPVFAGTSR